jgi:hypothetical protein
MIRSVKTLDDPKRLFVPVFFSILDQVIEILLRGFLSGVETTLSNGKSVVFTTLATVGWWVVTRRTQFSRWVGVQDAKFGALVAGFVLGIANSGSAAGAIVGGLGEAGGSGRPEQAMAAERATATTGAEAETETETPGPEKNIVNFCGTYEGLMKRISAEQGPVVVELWAVWNADSQKLQTRLPLIAVEHPEAKFIQVECGRNPDIAIAMEVDRIPDVRFYVGGSASGRVVGYDIEKIQETLLEFVKN